MSQFVRQIPDGDTLERLVCPTCGYIDYENPKVVVGSVVVDAGRVLLCRRAIQPRRGFWTLPAGYLEMGETIEDGARREALEEARARIALDGVLGIYSISRIGQVQVIFRGRFDGPATYAAGPESEDVRSVRLGRYTVGRDCLSDRALVAAGLARGRLRPAGCPRRQPARRPARHRPAAGRCQREGIGSMTPTRWLAALLLTLGMACGVSVARAPAAAIGTSIAAPLPANALLVPAPSPSQALTAPGFAPAPIPDPDLQRPPGDLALERPRTAVVPTLGSPTDRRDGQGYVQGSAAQYDPDRHLRATPSLSLKVPLQ